MSSSLLLCVEEAAGGGGTVNKLNNLVRKVSSVVGYTWTVWSLRLRGGWEGSWRLSWTIPLILYMSSCGYSGAPLATGSFSNRPQSTWGAPSCHLPSDCTTALLWPLPAPLSTSKHPPLHWFRTISISTIHYVNVKIHFIYLFINLRNIALYTLYTQMPDCT